MHSGMTIWLVEMPEEYHIIERERERKGEKMVGVGIPGRCNYTHLLLPIRVGSTQKAFQAQPPRITLVSGDGPINVGLKVKSFNYWLHWQQ